MATVIVLKPDLAGTDTASLVLWRVVAALLAGGPLVVPVVPGAASAGATLIVRSAHPSSRPTRRALNERAAMSCPIAWAARGSAVPQRRPLACASRRLPASSAGPGASAPVSVPAGWISPPTGCCRVGPSVRLCWPGPVYREVGDGGQGAALCLASSKARAAPRATTGTSSPSSNPNLQPCRSRPPARKGRFTWGTWDTCGTWGTGMLNAMGSIAFLGDLPACGNLRKREGRGRPSARERLEVSGRPA